jgi:DNA repair exonuclease SbcCD nuclease subunit
MDTISEKLYQIGGIAQHEKAAAVLDGGDFFHKKSPSMTSHKLIRQVADIHRAYPCPVYATVGNHDCVYGDIEYLYQQPLGVLFSTGVFLPLFGEHEAVFEEEGIKVRVVGVPYHGSTYNIEHLKPVRGDENYLVVVAHLLASPRGGRMFEAEDIVRYSDLEGCADAYCFGHSHTNQGVVKLGGTWFVNVGSMTRGTISEDDVARIPSIAILEFNKSEMRARKVALQVADSSDVFDLVAKEKGEARDELIDEFAEKIRNGSLVDISEEPLEDLVRAMPDIPDNVRERAILYLEQAAD